MYHGGTNEIENLNPACRMCNFYKSTFGIETLRKQTCYLSSDGRAVAL